MLIVFTDRLSTVNLYGVSGNELHLKNMATNEVFTLPVQANEEERFTLYNFQYDSEYPLNTGNVVYGVTHFNCLPGKYIYSIDGVLGIFYVIDNEKNNNITTYDQENNTKVYKR